MRETAGMESISIPHGWHKEALFGRLVTGCVCTYEYLSSPTTSMKAVFGMLRMMDLQDYCEAKSLEKVRKADGNR